MSKIELSDGHFIELPNGFDVIIGNGNSTKKLTGMNAAAFRHDMDEADSFISFHNRNKQAEILLDAINPKQKQEGQKMYDALQEDRNAELTSLVDEYIDCQPFEEAETLYNRGRE